MSRGQPKELRIGGSDYKLMRLGAAKGSEIWLDLLHVLAAPLEALGSTSNLDDAALAKAVAATLRSLDHPMANKLYAAFGPLSSVRVPSQTPGEPDRWPSLESAVFDEHFAGNYFEMTEWLVQSVIFNFFGFFGDGSLGNLVARLRAAIPPTSTTT